MSSEVGNVPVDNRDSGKNQSLEWARLWTQNAAEAVAENREFLIELDRQIGDADHGENMDRGFTAVLRGGGLEASQSAPELMKYIARTLLSTVGGAAGPLYGTAYLRASQEIKDGDLSPQDVVAILDAAVAGVQSRGKAALEEKTMVDAMVPAVEAAREAAAGGATAAATVRAAAGGAASGAEGTKPMRATKGRASYLGERSRGHVDPGAASAALILSAAAAAADSVFGGETNE